MPTDKYQLSHFKEGVIITIAGGIGGLLSFTYAIASKSELAIGLPWSLPAYVFLGMGAGYLGVYLIAKTDTSHLHHALGFSVACGLSWAPIMNASNALIKQNLESGYTNVLRDSKVKVQAYRDKIPNATESELKDIAYSIKNINDKVFETVKKTSNVENYELANETLSTAQASVKLISEKNAKLAKEISLPPFYPVDIRNLPVQFRGEGLLYSQPSEMLIVPVASINLSEIYTPKNLIELKSKQSNLDIDKFSEDIEKLMKDIEDDPRFKKK